MKKDEKYYKEAYIAAMAELKRMKEKYGEEDIEKIIAETSEPAEFIV